MKLWPVNQPLGLFARTIDAYAIVYQPLLLLAHIIDAQHKWQV